MAEKRFEKIYRQGIADVIEIWVDTQTGVNYIFRQAGYAGGITSAALDGLRAALAVMARYRKPKEGMN